MVLDNTTVIKPISQTEPGNSPVIGSGWCSLGNSKFPSGKAGTGRKFETNDSIEQNRGYGPIFFENVYDFSRNGEEII